MAIRSSPAEAEPPPLSPDLAYRRVSDQLAGIVLERPVRGRWIAGVTFAATLVLLLVVSVWGLLTRGIGVWGIQNTVQWGLAIANAVWWIGIAHAGTVVSALLLLFGQPWRSSLNRVAEATTVFAALCASLFPILHLGRPQLFYWLAPYEFGFGVWPQFRSPLLWDFFAFLAYLLVAIVFGYVGMIPDFAMLRDRARGRRMRALYGILSLGWRGSAAQWTLWREAYVTVAAVLAVLIAVHGGGALLFAVSHVPGWHATLLPVHLTFGAVFSGLAVIAMLAVALRHGFRLHPVITGRHLDALGKLLLLAGLLTAYGFALRAFHTFYAGDLFDVRALVNLFAGSYAGSHWTTVALAFAAPQILWWPRARRAPAALFLVGAAVTVGMWFERYTLIVGGLHYGYLPARWFEYRPTLWDWSLLAGTVGLFLLLFLLFVRIVPPVSVFEVQETLREVRRERAGG